MFKIIACVNKKNAIGKNGKLMYNIKNDIYNFARMTKFNGVVIMGRKTFESIGNKPLPDRINIVMTEDKEYSVDVCFDNLYITHSVADVYNLCEAFFHDKELFVIGGASIYKQFLDSGMVDEILLTTVNDDADGDTYFPEINRDEWYTYYKSMAQTSSYMNNDTSFYFEILRRGQE